VNVVFIGPPGAGKGVQAELLSKSHGLVALSTGGILRQAVSNRTPVGIRARAAMDAGRLVDDETMIGVVAERLDSPDIRNGFILDGFPRTVAQAEALDDLLAERELPLTAALELRVPDETLIRRITGRFACADCGQGYHDDFRKPVKDGVCDQCGGSRFTRRSDDNRETAAARLQAYHAETASILPYYRHAGKLKTLNGEGSVAEVAALITAALPARA